MLDTVATPMVGELDIVVTDVEALDETDVPPELVEVTKKVYGVFAVNPETLIGDDEPVPIKPPGLLVTVYPVIVPVPLGAVKATETAVVLDTVATPIIGALVRVVTAVEELDETDVPPELVEVTENVYGVFGVNPDTVIGDDEPVPIKPPGLLVTVYPVIVPVPLGAVKATLTTVELDTVAEPIVGALDFVVADDDALDETDVPPELVEVTEKVYGVFAVNPVTIIGDDEPVPVKPPGLLVTV